MAMGLYKIAFIAFVLSLLSPELQIVNAQDYLAFANRQFIHRLELGTYSLSTLYTDNSGNFIAFDYDYRRNLQYWTDVTSGPTGSIYKTNLDGGGFTTVISVSLDVPDGLAIDWLTNKLYWSEATPETISVLDLDSGHRLTLFTLPESSIPRGIALDPANGYMFWTDWGSPGKVERAYMDGTGRITIADTNLVWPNDITIDYESQTLYWVDASLDKVESAGYDGSNRQLLVSSGPGVYHPFSITFYDGTLYWTDWQDLVVTANSLESNTLSIVFSGLSTQPTGIEAISASRQEIVSTPCDTANGNCEQLCLLGAGRTATCACVEEYTLASDGRTCETPAYLGFANRYFIHRLDLSTFSLQTLVTGLNNNYIAFDYDYRRKYQYWTETYSTPISSIYRSNLQGEDVHLIISGSLDVPDGLAIDWLTNKLYWTEATPETISVLDLDSGHRLILFNLPESSIPRGIALDPANGYMFWTDWGSPGKVERAYMDGTGRITIADTNLVWPNDITIDYESQTLYWIDANLDNVESAGYDGSNRQLLVSSGVFHPFSITFFDGTLYWTDWQVDAVYAMAVGTNIPSIVFSGLTTEPMGIEAISPNRQEIVSTPCDTANGNCEQLCLLGAGRTATCACVNGYTLTSDGRTCTAVQDYLVFANRQFIQRLELGTYSLRTLYTDVTRNFIAFDYDYRRDFLYWTDVGSGSIFKSNLEGGRVTSVISGSLQVPDGLAIDWITNKLYWTEATPDTISVLDLDSGHRLTLFTLSSSSVPRGIALDPANGYMFWTDWGSPGKVERAYMDGTGRTTIADTNLVWPNDITIDYESQTLYWLDASLDKVESAGYDGSNRQLLISSGVLHPFSITFHENALYWTDWQSDAVYMKTTDSSTASIVYNRLGTEPMGIEAVSTSRQRLVSNPCDAANGNCDQLCLLSAGRAASCRCVEGYTLDSNGRTCNAITTVTPPSPTTPIQYGSCRNAGFTDCCLGGDCQGLPRSCFCDISCVILQDCCEDFFLICTAYTCSSLLSIPNGAIAYSQESTSNRYDIGTTATYSCSGRFYLSGGSTRSCTRSGTMGIWDGSASQCLAITCSTLNAPANGLVSYDPDLTAPYEFGTTATYICTTGFGLFGGSRTRECVVSSLGGGGWSGTTPTCGSITCPNLSPPSNGQVAFIAGPPFIYGTIATYSCNEGYTISVNIPRTCGGEGLSTSGVWSGEAPSCTAISCPDLIFPTNGLIAFSSTPPYSFGTVATYSCVSGFGLSGGGRTRTCGGDGSSQGVWSGPPVNCGAITCPSLGLSNNGVIEYSPTTTSPSDFGTTATYTCNEGFFLEGESILTCGGDGLSVNGVWSDPAPVCAAVMCLVLLYPDNGVITYSEDSIPAAGFMETATYSCNPGFGLSGGDTVRTCVGAAGSSGEWTGTAPTCQAITCSALSPPTDGRISFSTDTTPPHVFGTVATFTCAAGFALRGDTTRMCEGDGTTTSGVWSGSSPTCSAYMCSSLPQISNGLISYSPDSSSPFDYGTIATYSCNGGFYLMELSMRSCSGSGSLVQGYWLGQEPECAAIVCTSLAPLNNGLLSYGPDTASPYDYQTTATYSCNEGYGLFGGDRARQCDSSSPGDGGWSGTTPTCETVICPSLSPPTNGRVTFSSASPYSSGTMASFSCNEGYGLSDGDGMLTCGGDDSSPNGAWSRVVPTCEAITCTALILPTNGMIAFSSTPPYSFGVVATYSCVSGFGLSEGETTRTCGGDGSSQIGVWSGPVVSCGPITCPSLSPINNGVIAYSPIATSSIDFGGTATYTCNEGFYLTGSTAQTCGGDGSSVGGSWSDSPPVCAAIMCPVLTYPENSVIMYSEDSSSSLDFMETATYSCNPGFGLSGGDTVRTCVGAAGSSGEWTGVAPTCQAITCPPLSPPSSGKVSYSTDLGSDTDSSYSYETVATFTCITGYGVSGDTTITCLGDGATPNGVWNGFSPICLAYTCTMLPPFPNGVITYDPDRSNPFQFGTTASFFCNEGFYVSGHSSIRICNGSGATSFWEGEQPVCIATVCTSLAPPTNGFISFGPDTTSPYDYQTTATYVCIEGYGLFGGDRTRQCISGSVKIGQWSGIAPMCETITCPSQSPPINGRVDFSTDFLLTHGTMATFSCDVGYGLSGGDMMTTCGGDGSDPFGTWIGAVPACEPITCSPLSSVTNGNIVYSRDTTTTFTFSTVATYSCNEGFLLLGNNKQSCSGDGSSVNGLWSGGSTPVCTAFLCLKLSLPISGVITYSENAMGFVSTATYSCNSGFGLSEGDTVRTCVGATGSSGKWNGTAPSCQAVLDVSEQRATIGGGVSGSLLIIIAIVAILVIVPALIVYKRRKGKDDFRPQRFNNDPERVDDNSYEPVVAKLNPAYNHIQAEGNVMTVENPLYGEDLHGYENVTEYSQHDLDDDGYDPIDNVKEDYGDKENYGRPIDNIKQYYDEVVDSSEEDFDDPMENNDHVSVIDSEGYDVIARRDYENSNPVYADDITLIN